MDKPLKRIKQAYYKPEPGEWLTPVMSPYQYRFACCDCGLVHNFEYRIVKGKVQFRPFENKRATAAIRRHQPHKCVPVEVWQMFGKELGRGLKKPRRVPTSGSKR
jgi:hypothetical protein